MINTPDGLNNETQAQPLGKLTVQSLVPANFLRRLRAYRSDLDQQWMPVGLRHTDATDWLGVHNDRARLAELLGNSVEVIGRH